LRQLFDGFGLVVGRVADGAVDVEVAVRQHPVLWLFPENVSRDYCFQRLVFLRGWKKKSMF
jgi:hypothetical protein